MSEGSVPQTPPPAPLHVPRLVITWVLALVSAIAVLLWAPVDLREEWLVLAIGFNLITSFILQIGTAQREGFITRLSYAVAGAALLIGLTWLVAFIAGAL